MSENDKEELEEQQEINDYAQEQKHDSKQEYNGQDLVQGENDNVSGCS